MGIIRKIVSLVVLVAAVVTLVGLCMSSTMESVWSMFGDAFSPFNFSKLANALAAFFMVTGNAIVLIMLGFIGLTMPSRHN